MEVFIISNKRNWNEKEKLALMINMIECIQELVFFISSHFVERNSTYYWFKTNSNNDFIALQTKFKYEFE